MKKSNHLEVLKEGIIKKGGFSNSHAHLDRAYTVNSSDILNLGNKHLFEKWELVDAYKSIATEDMYYKNIDRALESQMNFGVKRITTFIDLDSVVKDKALNAALICKSESKEKYDIDLKIACQTLKGVLKSEEKKLLEKHVGKFDIIGSLPRADGDIRKHLLYLMNLSKDTGKKLHVHVDQLNTILEKETELLARMTIDCGIEGMVSAVHSISLACHPKAYRNEVYKICRDAGLNFISCPTAWIDSRRNETLTVTHNALTPADEIVANNLNICIGSDNIFDIYKPFSDGDMMTELRFLLEGNHLYDTDILSDIASSNYFKTI